MNKANEDDSINDINDNATDDGNESTDQLAVGGDLGETDATICWQDPPLHESTVTLYSALDSGVRYQNDI